VTACSKSMCDCVLFDKKVTCIILLLLDRFKEDTRHIFVDEVSTALFVVACSFINRGGLSTRLIRLQPKASDF